MKLKNFLWLLFLAALWGHHLLAASSLILSVFGTALAFVVYYRRTKIIVKASHISEVYPKN